MIDTIKFLVPFEDDSLLEKLKTVFTQTKQEDFKTGKVNFEFYTAKAVVGSHNRSINVKIVDNEYYFGLFVEFSVPKYEKGNNVEMVLPSQLPVILEKFYQEICTHLSVELPHISLWQIFRLDLCYNWIFKTKEEAETVMGFIQRIDYPRKKKFLYNTSVMYTGSAFTIKFYLKGAEYKVNGYTKDEISNRTSEIQVWADRIVRFEIGFKKQYLQDIFGYKPVLLEHVQNDKQIEGVLIHYLYDKTLRYITLKNRTEGQIEELIYGNFSKIKATRLYQFYRDFYLDGGAVKSRMLAGGLDRATIWRYKKDLKSIGVGFDLPDLNGTSLLEQLVIPSENSKFDLIGYPEDFFLAKWDSKVV